jgi:probable HAF family extracellular repeat protein
VFSNSYSWTDGERVGLQHLPQRPNLTGTGTYINWINQWRVSAGYGTRTDPTTGVSFDHAALWLPNGRIVPLGTPAGAQSRAVWINDLGQASGWIAADSIVDPCSFGAGFRSQAVIWALGVPHALGSLGGGDSYGEFINDRGQISGHAQTSNVADPNLGCPPFDPFVWQAGKMIDINPGNFGGAEGGTNFLNNHGDAVGFGTLPGESLNHAFLWNDGKLTDLTNVGSLGAQQDSAFNVNEEGHVVGVSVTPEGTILSVLWRNGEFTNLTSLSAQGDDCSEPFRINSEDQVVGLSFSCETGVQHAFLWERGEMVDLNSLIPADSGLQLLAANWIDDDGVIAAQAVVTAGDASGASRAVLLIPAGECSARLPSASANHEAATRVSAAKLPRGAFLHTAEGRVNPLVVRPFDPAKLLGLKDR